MHVTRAIVREWIVERPERNSVEAQMRRTARLWTVHDRVEDDIEPDLDD